MSVARGAPTIEGMADRRAPAGGAPSLFARNREDSSAWSRAPVSALVTMEKALPYKQVRESAGVRLRGRCDVSVPAPGPDVHGVGRTDAGAGRCEPVGVYVHIPFCRTKCTYCDFTAIAGLNHRAEAYLDALEREAEARTATIERTVATVFFGGGTPSELAPAQLRRCLRFVLERSAGSAGGSARGAARSPAGGYGAPLPSGWSTRGAPAAREILRRARDDEEASAADRDALPARLLSVELEANPESLDHERLAVLREEGVTRLSIGVQTFDDGELSAIARFHGAQRAVEAFEAARQWDFDSISLDLMLGIPGQTVGSWGKSLDQAIALAPDHVSAYGLTLEPATPLARQVRRGRVTVPDDDEQASMYALACERLARAGYRHYEVSNWAQPGHESAHNRSYWRGKDYLGLGAGATSTVEGRRWTNHRPLERYIASASERGVAEGEVATLSPDEARSEMVMLGLRTAEGVSRSAFKRRFGQSVEAWGEGRLQALQHAGLLRWEAECLVVPEERWFVLHGIVAALLAGD